MNTFSEELAFFKAQAEGLYDKKTKDLTFKEAVALYALDPNCRAELWISDKGFSHWTAKAKSDFIEIGNILKYNHVQLS